VKRCGKLLGEGLGTSVNKTTLP